jgi:hypothetical protein
MVGQSAAWADEAIDPLGGVLGGVLARSPAWGVFRGERMGSSYLL